MGLDNGIMVRRNEASMGAYNKLACFEDSWDTNHEWDFEICYWRKCWNIRHLIFNILNESSDNYEYHIYREDIPKIIDILKSLNDKNWTDNGSSIWTYQEQKPHIKQHIKNLKKIYKLMKEYDLDVYFYDSY